MSKRHIRRLIKKQRDTYFNNLRSAGVSGGESGSATIVEMEEPVIDARPVSGEDLGSDLGDKKEDLRSKLLKWYLECRPTRKCVEGILKVLRSENLDVPLSADSLLAKHRQRALIEHVSPGFYCHIGVKKQLEKLGSILINYDPVYLDVNIDGVPLFRSSRTQLWPILLRLVNVKNASVFCVGVYLGAQKPSCVEKYLSAFTEEMTNILENGVHILGKVVNIKIRSIVCDAPAKSFICGVPGHTSAFGCGKCTQVGQKIQNTLVYSVECGDLINDEHFANRAFENHHIPKFRNKATPLEILGVNMISQIAIDGMHLIDLGVMRKFLLRIIQGKINIKVTKEDKDNISAKLESLKPYITKEFVRKPRGLSEIYNWKAVEFRQFLLYTGIAVLRDRVAPDIYYEFLLLHCACRLLFCPKSYLSNIDVAETMLALFVQNFPIIFGATCLTYNVHSLLHLTDNIKSIGLITGSTAYDFENYLQVLKKYVRKPTKILQQLYNNISSESLIKEDNNNGLCQTKRGDYVYFQNDCVFVAKPPDNYCIVKPNTAIQILRFSLQNGGSVTGKKLVGMESFFTEPEDSTTLGIYIADSEPAEEEEIYCVSDIESKLLVLPHDGRLLIIPILHSSC